MSIKQKGKKKVKQKKLKTHAERADEINTLRTKILSIGFPIKSKGIEELFSRFYVVEDNYI